MKFLSTFLLSFFLVTGIASAQTEDGVVSAPKTGADFVAELSTEIINGIGGLSPAVGIGSGILCAAADVLTGGHLTTPIWLSTAALRGSIYKQSVKGELTRSMGDALAWAAYFLTFSRLNPFINPAQASLNPTFYLVVMPTLILAMTIWSRFSEKS